MAPNSHEGGLKTPVAVDAADFLSDEAKARKPGALRSIVAQFAGKPGIVGMHGGLPPTDSFPLESIEIKLKDGAKITIEDPSAMASLQQYGIAPKGYPPLLEWLKEHVQEQHAPPAEWDLIVTTGSTHTIHSALSCFMNPGDPLLIEEHTYSHFLEATLWPRGTPLLPVKLDGEGVVPESLEQVLEDYAKAHPEGPRPRVLYTVPNGQNPTGASSPPERLDALYAICRRHNLLILEDDPYYYLHFDADAQPASYLQRDVDGRVLRVDSFAKCLAPGMRLGWLSGPPSLVGPVCEAIQGSTMGANSSAQVIAHALLTEWGLAGFTAHVRKTAAGYGARCAALCDALETECGSLVNCVRPAAGMFAWVELPSVQDTAEVQAALVEEGVVTVPGRVFNVQGHEPGFKTRYIRLSFSAATEDQLREGARRIGAALRATQQ